MRNLLVMRLDNIGDVIMTGPALRAIRAAMPRVHLTFMASPAGAGIAPLLPWVDDVFAARVLWQDLGNLSFDPGREKALIDDLRDRRFDGVIIFTSFSQSPYPAGLACLLAGIPLRAGASKETAPGVLTMIAPPIDEEVHQVERNLRLVQALGVPVIDTDLFVEVDEYSARSAERLLEVRGLSKGRPYILLSPWASAQARIYPTECFMTAARGIIDRTGLPVVLTGAGKHSDCPPELAAGLGRDGKNVVGMTTVRELAALVRGARLVLTNNTSTMHLADAFRTPAVVLYSGTERESQWQPRATVHRLLRRQTSCSPCYAFKCPSRMECLDIPPEDVVSAALELLERTEGRRESDRERKKGVQRGAKT